MGVKYLTVYAFSTENWSRPQDEVDALMKLLRNYMKTCLKTAAKNDMKVRVIGDISRLDEDIRTRIQELTEATKAVSYTHLLRAGYAQCQDADAMEFQPLSFQYAHERHV